MKTITPKNALKLFLFLLILFSAKAFSFTRVPSGVGSSAAESRIGCVYKTAAMPKVSANSVASRGRVTQSKNIAMRSNLGPRVSLKFGW